MNKLCPLTADPCMEHKCQFFMPVVGTHPNTGEPMRPYECAYKLTPVFLMGVISSVTKLDGEVSAARKELRQATAQLNDFFATLNERLSNVRSAERDVSQVHLSDSARNRRDQSSDAEPVTTDRAVKDKNSRGYQ